MASFKGRSTRNVECIARIIGPEKDRNGNIKGYNVEFQTNEAIYTDKEIREGKGQEVPYLVIDRMAESKIDDPEHNKRAYDKRNSVLLTKKQYESLMEAIGDNRFTGDGDNLTEKGQTYGAFRADVNVCVKQNVKDKNGDMVKDENGNPETKIIGRMPNPKTFKPSAYYHGAELEADGSVSFDHCFNSGAFQNHIYNVMATNNMRERARENSAPKKFDVEIDAPSAEKNAPQETISR